MICDTAQAVEDWINAEGYASDAHQLGRYAVQRWRAILMVTVIDLERRLTDAVLDMADKLVGGFFAKCRSDRSFR